MMKKKNLYKVTFDYHDKTTGKYGKAWTEAKAYTAKDAIRITKHGFSSKGHKNFKTQLIKKSKIDDLFK